MTGWEEWGFECEEGWRFSWCGRERADENSAHGDEMGFENRYTLTENDDDMRVSFARAAAAALALACVVFSYVAVVCNAGRWEASMRNYSSTLQPDGWTFSIAWLLIYTTSLISLVAQLLNLHPDVSLHTASAEANFCYAGAWLGCALWVYVVAVERADVDRPQRHLVFASVTLVAAAAFALVATGLERSVRSGDAARIAVVGFPYGIFAGWLVVAAVLSVDIAVAHARATGADGGGENDDVEGPRILFASTGGTPTSSSSSSRERAVVVTAALGVGVAAGLLPDPFFPLPLAFAISRMPIELACARGLALGALFAASAAAVLLGMLRVWV